MWFKGQLPVQCKNCKSLLIGIYCIKTIFMAIAQRRGEKTNKSKVFILTGNKLLQVMIRKWKYNERQEH